MTKPSNQRDWMWLGAVTAMSLGCLSLEPLSEYSDGSSGAQPPALEAVDPEPPADELEMLPRPEEAPSIAEGLPADGELALQPAPAPESEPLPPVEPAPMFTCTAVGEFPNEEGTACYLRSAQGAAWADALASCQAWGGELVVIDSREEDAFLGEHVDTSFWIGASDRSQEGRMSWNSGAPLAFENWAAGEPNDYQAREDCVVKTMPMGSWNDLPCRNLNAYVCERGPD